MADSSRSSADSTTRIARRSTILESLQYRDFRWLWLGSLVAYMSLNLQMLNRSWLVVILEDNSPIALALVMMSFALPMTFVSPIGGVLADKWSKKKLIAASQIGSAVVTFGLGILDFTGVIQFWHLLASGLLNGVMMAINVPSRQAIVSDIVPKEALMNAISLNNSAMSITRILGPALGGFMIVYFVDWIPFLDSGTAGVFFVIAAVYIFAALSILRIKTDVIIQQDKLKSSFIKDLFSGLVYVVHHKTIRVVLFVNLIGSVFGWAFMTLMPAWARVVLDVNADDLGILLTVIGVGSLVATLGLASLSNFKYRGALLIASCLLWGLSLALISKMDQLYIVYPLLLFIGIASGIFMSLGMTLMQYYSEPEMRGRVMSVAVMPFGVSSMSAVPFGIIATNIGIENSLMISGILLVFFTIVIVLIFPFFTKVE
ncbi:MAG: MFS transporter [Dehalococcoidia bacterium]